MTVADAIAYARAHAAHDLVIEPGQPLRLILGGIVQYHEGIVSDAELDAWLAGVRTTNAAADEAMRARGRFDIVQAYAGRRVRIHAWLHVDHRPRVAVRFSSAGEAFGEHAVLAAVSY